MAAPAPTVERTKGLPPLLQDFTRFDHFKQIGSFASRLQDEIRKRGNPPPGGLARGASKTDDSPNARMARLITGLAYPISEAFTFN